MKTGIDQEHRLGAADDGDETVLLVAVCAGARCRALRVLRRRTDPLATDQTNADSVDPCGQTLRSAVRDRSHAVLLSTDCLAQCHHGSVAAIGWATCARSGRLRWLHRPVFLGMLDLPDRAAAAADWIRHAAPDPDTLPVALARPDVA